MKNARGVFISDDVVMMCVSVIRDIISSKNRLGGFLWQHLIFTRTKITAWPVRVSSDGRWLFLSMKAAQQSEPLGFIQMYKVTMIYSSVAQRKQVEKIIPACSRNYLPPGHRPHTISRPGDPVFVVIIWSGWIFRGLWAAAIGPQASLFLTRLLTRDVMEPTTGCENNIHLRQFQEEAEFRKILSRSSDSILILQIYNHHSTMKAKKGGYNFSFSLICEYVHECI